MAFAANSIREFGNAVKFSSTKDHNLSKVIVSMSSWGCEFGRWNLHNCVTSDKASFEHPITLNVYNPSSDGINPGAKIVSVTQTFSIKFRPSASTKCTLGRWYDNVTKNCYNGHLQNITFDLKNVQVGSEVIFGVAYNTSHHGYAPIGQSASCYTASAGCGYDSLNVGLSQDPTDITRGSSTVAGKLWRATASATFRAISFGASSPWYVPSIKVFANQK